MIKFLVICVLIFSFYLGVSALGQLDSVLTFAVYDYSVETTFFTAIALLLIATFFIVILLKMIFLPFEAAYLVRKKLQVWKEKKLNEDIVNSLVQIILGNSKKAAELVQKIAPDFKSNQKELAALIQSVSEEDTDKKINYLKEIVEVKAYSFFAAKQLAQIFVSKGQDSLAEECAIKAFNLNEKDSEILEVLIDCYANLLLWPKLTFVVSKLAKIAPERLTAIGEKVARHYLLAAKNMLELGKDEEATGFLESALELEPTYIEALELYLALNLDLKQQAKNNEILAIAFRAKPCFEIAEIYIKYSSLPAKRIYEELEKMVNPQEQVPLFLALAAYLNLPEKISGLTEPKLLSYES